MTSSLVANGTAEKRSQTKDGTLKAKTLRTWNKRLEGLSLEGLSIDLWSKGRE
jgi:hypothetical protein